MQTLMKGHNSSGSSLFAKVPSGLQMVNTGFIQARLCKIQGLLKDFPTVFKDWKLKKLTDLQFIFYFWNARVNN